MAFVVFNNTGSASGVAQAKKDIEAILGFEVYSECN
jgi:hypothetical protein